MKTHNKTNQTKIRPEGVRFDMHRDLGECYKFTEQKSSNTRKYTIKRYNGFVRQGVF